MNSRLAEVAEAGAVGTISEQQAGQRIAEILGLDAGQLRAFLADLWTEYLGTLNTDLAAYFASLRPRYRTGIISNSFVGARHREQQRYGFADHDRPDRVLARGGRVQAGPADLPAGL